MNRQKQSWGEEKENLTAEVNGLKKQLEDTEQLIPLEMTRVRLPLEEFTSLPRDASRD